VCNRSIVVLIQDRDSLVHCVDERVVHKNEDRAIYSCMHTLCFVPDPCDKSGEVLCYALEWRKYRCARP
jgi:hypothetical protein